MGEETVRPVSEMLTLYFDTNVFDALYRRGPGCPEGLELRRAVKAGQLRIAISLDVIDETAEAALSDWPLALGRLNLIKGLYDARFEVLPAGTLLRNGIVEALTDAKPSSPFSDNPLDIGILCNLLSERLTEFTNLVDEQRVEKAEYAEILRACRNDVRIGLAEMEWPKVRFAHHLEEADWITQAAVDHYFGPGELPVNVLRKLLSSRPVRMHRDVLFSMYYAQSVEGRAPKDSDLIDVHHAITASVAHGIVTEDAPLRGILRRTTIPGFQVLSLHELIASLRLSTN